MEKKEPMKINVTTVLLIITIVIIGVMSYFMYEQKLKSDNEISILQEDAKRSQSTINEMQTKLDNISNIANNAVEEPSSTSAKKDDIVYEITTRNDQYGDTLFATIKATKNGKTVTKELKMAAQIDETGTIDIPQIGKVAAVTESAGEGCGVILYQLVDSEIKKIGIFDMGADIVEEATYTVENKSGNTVIINAKRNGETFTKEVKMNTKIVNTKILDVFGTKVVMVAGEDTVQVYRLSQDYTNGKTKEILNVGEIQ